MNIDYFKSSPYFILFVSALIQVFIVYYVKVFDLFSHNSFSKKLHEKQKNSIIRDTNSDEILFFGKMCRNGLCASDYRIYIFILGTVWTFYLLASFVSNEKFSNVELMGLSFLVLSYIILLLFSMDGCYGFLAITPDKIAVKSIFTSFKIKLYNFNDVGNVSYFLKNNKYILVIMIGKRQFMSSSSSETEVKNIRAIIEKNKG